MYRNKNCGELNIKNVGENVVIAGWVQRIRNLGSMKFIDLRDQFGITQIIVNDNCADNLVTECVIQVDGTVIERTNKNSKIPTGEIEIEAKKIEVLGTCKMKYQPAITHSLLKLPIQSLIHVTLVPNCQ